MHKPNCTCLQHELGVQNGWLACCVYGNLFQTRRSFSDRSTQTLHNYRDFRIHWRSTGPVSGNLGGFIRRNYLRVAAPFVQKAFDVDLLWEKFDWLQLKTKQIYGIHQKDQGVLQLIFEGIFSAQLQLDRRCKQLL